MRIDVDCGSLLPFSYTSRSFPSLCLYAMQLLVGKFSTAALGVTAQVCLVIAD